MSCSKTQHLVLAGIELPLSGLIQQTTEKKKRKKIVSCFITKKTGFDISCNGDNLHEMQILFSWKNDRNISKCLLKTLPRMLSVMVCRNKSRMGLCMVKPIITCTKRRISLHTLSLHISSLIRAFSNRMYRLQSMGLTKRLVRRAKTWVNLRNCTFWSEHSLIVFTFDSRAVQSGINSVTVTSHSDQILRWSYSMHLLRTPGYPRSLLYIVGRCTNWPESLLVALYYSTFCGLVHYKSIVNHTFVPT